MELSESTNNPAGSIWPDNASLNEIFFLGQTKMSREKYLEAISCFEHLSIQKRFINENEVILRERALYEIARCNLKLKKYKTSVQNFREFIKLCPKSTLINDAWFYLGDIYLLANNEENAKICFKKAALLPNPKHLNTLQRAKKKLKQLGINI
jgi:TolA-binding protein